VIADIINGGCLVRFNGVFARVFPLARSGICGGRRRGAGRWEGAVGHVTSVEQVTGMRCCIAMLMRKPSGRPYTCAQVCFRYDFIGFIFCFILFFFFFLF
jgi:hypothetical protein